MAIPNVTQQYHHVGDVAETIGMSMRADDFPHIAELLNSLYSNPLAAVIREYATNVFDSHVMAGNTAPIAITLPTEDSMTFIVQDFGLGMSVDDLRNTYSLYGRSDKRGTNAVAGQLGLGSKSGLSYATAFTVVGVKGGVKTTAVITKDKHGVGEIMVRDTVGTDEPNGVQIKIPVDRWDVSRFRDEANSLFQFWDEGTVLIDGEAPEAPDWLATALRVDDDLMLIRQDAGLYRSYVVMGNVPYPVPDANVGRVSQRFVARLNMGDVDFVPSREEVKHTAHTDATLAELSEYVKDSYQRAIDAALGAVSTRWDETLLKTLWMDRNMVLTSDLDRPIWTFDPSGYGHRKARSNYKVRVDALAQPKVTVITGFGPKNVSTAARERLEAFAQDNDVKPYFVILPANVPGVGALDGRPNTFTWDEVVGATDEPVVKGVKVKRPKFETKYAVSGRDAMTSAQLAEVTDKVVYLLPNEAARPLLTNVLAVTLRSSNQVARLVRLVPGIEPYQNEVTRQRAAADKAVTDQDRAILKARTLGEAFHQFDADQVDDPELADALRLRALDDTTTMTDAKRFGVEIKHGSVSTMFHDRYPLVADQPNYYHRRSDNFGTDALFYLNAKYADISSQLSLDTRAS